MPGPVTDPRAGALLRRYRETFGGEEIPVPVESIAEDLLGLRIEESGYWVCQVLEGRWQPVFCREVEAGGNGYPPLEREANVFAAELLMPMEAVRDVFRAADSIEMTATRFGVSAPAMDWRLYNAGLVREQPAKDQRA